MQLGVSPGGFCPRGSLPAGWRRKERLSDASRGLEGFRHTRGDAFDRDGATIFPRRLSPDSPLVDGWGARAGRYRHEVALRAQQTKGTAWCGSTWG